MQATLLSSCWLFLLAVCYAPAAQAQSVAINFYEGNWQEVLDKAQNEGKLIFVDVYADYCPPCKMMDKQVFTNKTLALFFNENFVSFKINLSKRENAYFQTLHQLQELPALLFFDGEGKVVRKETGCKDVPEMMQYGRQVLTTHTQSFRLVSFAEEQLYYEQLSKWYEGGKKTTTTHFQSRKTTDLLHDYAHLLKTYRQPYDRVVNEYLAAQLKSDLQSEQNRRFIYDFAINADNQALRYFVADIGYFKGRYGSQRVNDKVKTAAYNSIITAVREQNRHLFNEVMAVIAEANLPQQTAYQFHLQTLFYEGIGDWNNYARVAYQYLHRQQISDPHLLNQVAYTFYEHVNSKKMLAEAVHWAKKAVDIENDYTNNVTLMYLYNKLGKQNKAIEAGQQALGAAEKDKEVDSLPTQRMLDRMTEQ